MTVANANTTGQVGPQPTRAPAPPARSGTQVVPEAPQLPQQAVPGTERSQESSVQSDATRRGRLAFDQELSRVFVEIVDKESGEVLLRFPPEEIVRHMAELKQAKDAARSDDNGLVLDQVV